MSDNTNIEWTDATLSPMTGCTPASTGCLNCCAKNMCNRFGEKWGRKNGRDFSKIEFDVKKLERFERIRHRKPKRVFLNLMSDTFHEEARTEWMDRLLSTISVKKMHTFIILTKRADRMADYFNAIVNNNERYAGKLVRRFTRNTPYYDAIYGNLIRLRQGKPIPNLWLLVTAENQKQYDRRVPELLSISAAVHGVSVEPMLEEIDTDIYLKYSNFGCGGAEPIENCEVCGHLLKQKIDWIICGAETGPGARPMNPDWARSLRDQAVEAGIPFFFKKMSNGEKIPPDLMIRQFPKGDAE